MESKRFDLKSPFPAFGGKKKVSGLVWSYLGNPTNFIEPFCNSAAVLLNRPDPGRIETVNDANDYIANFWRAVKHDPEAVVDFADHPVNEVDLHSIHRWLVGWRKPAPPMPARFARHPLLAEAWSAGAEAASIGDGRIARFRAAMKDDPEFYDAKVAGWWVWGACCWIGSGWCDAGVHWQQLPELNSQRGVHGEMSNKLPDISGHANGSGRGVHQASGPSQYREQIPRLSAAGLGQGIHADGPSKYAPPSDLHRPQLADVYARGRGVHANDSAGTVAQRRAWLLDWFGRLSDRLRTVRVCCGDWKRVCDSESVTTRIGTTGIFLDPPYRSRLADGSANRADGLYANDRHQDLDALVDGVIAYCVERGNLPGYRIVAASYEGEGYEVLLGKGWTCIPWRASGGYANRGKGKASNDNAARERLWVSPGCLHTVVARHDEYHDNQVFALFS